MKMRYAKQVLIGCVLIIGLVSKQVYAEEVNGEIDFGDYGKISVTERAPEQNDTSNWLTVQTGETGVRIISKDNKEIVAVDSYGGIYLNGDVYLTGDLSINGKRVSLPGELSVNGFMYFLIVLSLLCNCYFLMKKRR